MSTYKCPECGNPINLNERHCANCDYDVTDKEYAALVPAPAPVVEKPKAPQTVTPQKTTSAPGIDSIMAHGSVDASSHSTHNEDKSTHNIDNSQTVNNTNQTVTNTFIIMGGGPAPIPQNIDPQTAEALKQAQQAQAQQAAQQQATPTFSASAQPQAAAPAAEGSKGLGSIDGTITKNQKKSKKGWIAIVAAVVVVAVVATLTMGGNDEQPANQTTTATTTSKNTKATTTTTTTTTTKATQEASAQKVASAPATNKTAAKPKPKEPTLAEMTPAQAYSKGMQLFDKGNYSQAVMHLEKAANANHADAAYQLGEMYLSGVGVDANKETAIRWYKVAAKAGHKQAKRKLF